MTSTEDMLQPRHSCEPAINGDEAAINTLLPTGLPSPLNRAARLPGRDLPVRGPDGGLPSRILPHRLLRQSQPSAAGRRQQDMTTQPNTPGHDRRLCGSLKRDGSGDTCTLPAGWGTDHVGAGNCRKHLGNSPNAVTHARHVMAADACERFGVPIETSAEAALLDALAHAAGDVVFYRARVQELSREQMVYGAERVTRTARLNGQGQGQVIEDITRAVSRPRCLGSAPPRSTAPLPRSGKDLRCAQH